MKLKIREYDCDHHHHHHQNKNNPSGNTTTTTTSFDSSATTTSSQDVLEYYLSSDRIVTSSSSWLSSSPSSLTITTATTTNDDNNITTSTSTSQQKRRRLLLKGLLVVINNIKQRLHKLFTDLFLPIGYPDSVGPEYLTYQIYDSLQGLCSYIRGVITTSSVLKAVGVGDANATSLSAALSWALRDGVALLGGLVFSYVASPTFDSHVKEYRLFADIINDVGLTLDMISPVISPGYLIYVMALATLCKVACGMAAGATKASITLHLASRGGNVADLNAKESTQETLVTLVGWVGGTGLARWLNREEEGEAGGMMGPMIIFLILTMLHVWANYKGVMVLRLKTLNRERAEVALEDVTERCVRRVLVMMGRQQATTTTISRSKLNDNDNDVASFMMGCEEWWSSSLIKSPSEVKESLLSSTGKLLFGGGISLNGRLGELLSCRRDGRGCDKDTDTTTDATWIFQQFMNDAYVLGINQQNVVCVVLRRGATDDDKLRAFVQAVVIRKSLMELQQRRVDVLCLDRRSKRMLIEHSHVCIKCLFDDEIPMMTKANGNDGCEILHQQNKQSRRSSPLQILSDRGWDCDTLYLGFGRWRLDWDNDDKDE